MTNTLFEIPYVLTHHFPSYLPLAWYSIQVFSTPWFLSTLFLNGRNSVINVLSLHVLAFLLVWSCLVLDIFWSFLQYQSWSSVSCDHVDHHTWPVTIKVPTVPCMMKSSQNLPASLLLVMSLSRFAPGPSAVSVLCKYIFSSKFFWNRNRLPPLTKDLFVRRHRQGFMSYC